MENVSNARAIMRLGIGTVRAKPAGALPKCVVFTQETPCIKLKLYGEAKEEPSHIIRECEAFCQERLEAFNFLEWHPDMEWTVNQMMRFLDKTRVRNLEEEEESDNN